MLKTKIILLVTVLLTAIAGVTVGRLSVVTPTVSVTAPTTRPGHGDHRQGWTNLLSLSPDQASKVAAIWAPLRPKLDAQMEEHKTLDDERAGAIAAIFSPSQLAEYDKVLADYAQKRADLDKSRQSLLDDANAQTRALLDPSQQTKWDGMLKQQQQHEHGHGPGPAHGMTHTSNNVTATTQP